MAGDQFTDSPKGTPPANDGGEILLAQLTGQPRGKGSLADEIIKGKPAGETPKEPPPPGDTKPVAKPADTPVAPKDAPATAADGKDVVLSLSYTDPKFD